MTARTREQGRHGRATVLQQLGAQADADPRAFWAANRARAAELRRGVRTGGESDGYQGLGVVTGKSVAGGNSTADSPAICKYCQEPTGGHYAWCEVF